MNKAQKIDIKRQQLNHLRHAIAHTMGPPRPRRGSGLGLVALGFVAGVVIERLGWRRVGDSAVSINRWVTLALHAVTPALAFLQKS